MAASDEGEGPQSSELTVEPEYTWELVSPSWFRSEHTSIPWKSTFLQVKCLADFLSLLFWPLRTDHAKNSIKDVFGQMQEKARLTFFFFFLLPPLLLPLCLNPNPLHHGNETEIYCPVIKKEPTSLPEKAVDDWRRLFCEYVSWKRPRWNGFISPWLASHRVWYPGVRNHMCEGRLIITWQANIAT